MVAGVKVLVVENHTTAEDRRLLDEALRQGGICPAYATGADEALEVLRLAQHSGQAYQVAVIDVELPAADGLALARQIRQDGQLPAIALILLISNRPPQQVVTKPAPGAAVQLSKPVDPQALCRVIGELLASHASASKPPVSEDSQPAYQQVHAALESFGRHGELLNELIEIFRHEAPARIEQMRQSLQCGDAPSLRLAAHTLKGSVRYFGAEHAAQLALKLETRGREGDFGAAAEELAELEQEMEKLIAVLLDYVARDKGTC